MTEEKVEENRVRRMAERRGYMLKKSRRRDEAAVDFGGYMLVDATGNSAVLGAEHFAFSATLADVERYLAIEGSRRRVRRLMMVAFSKISPESVFPRESLRKRLTDNEDYGRDSGDLGTALTHGQSALGEFTDNEFAVVDDAFARFGKRAPSKQIRECCVAMIRLAAKVTKPVPTK